MTNADFHARHQHLLHQLALYLRETATNLLDTAMYDAALAAARLAEPHAALTDASAHILAITQP
ncbi:hypothetical protein [Streptomyces subrutilus]|uniref:hypothetical protein n=1 Tax=Streptomyces subrutilus TaxID=36818 RepID=UPI002E157ABC|nr:hypothetical protein OG479_06880 [Streptomyces subrutilus]